MKAFLKRLAVVAASGGTAAVLDMAHQMKQGYVISDDWQHIGAAFFAGALISLAHVMLGTPASSPAPAGAPEVEGAGVGGV
jgi:hypothetical protein